MRKRLHLGIILWGLALAPNSVMPLNGQETPTPPAQPQERVDLVDLVFEREVFFYPSYERRDPFGPLLTGTESGPRFEEIHLIGIIYSTNPGQSLAMFGLKAAPTGAAAGTLSFRVRRGERLGNVRILEIQQTRVVVQIEEFGMTEQRIMELPRPGQGGLR